MLLSCTAVQFETSKLEHDSFRSVRDFRAQSANLLVHFGTSERRAQIIWLSSGLQSANHLIQFGTSERRARIIWFSSGLQSAERKSFGCAERKSFDSVRDFRAQIIWFRSGLQSTERMCVYVYILYMRYQKGQICLLKHVSKYI